MKVLGIGASSGIAIYKVFKLETVLINITDNVIISVSKWSIILALSYKMYF